MKCKLVIDMDDVICEGGFLKLLNTYLNKEYKQDDFKDFYMQDVIDDKEGFYNFFLEHNLYDYTFLKDDAYDVLKKLNEKYEIFICTDYIYREIVDRSGIIAKYKFDYLRKELPFIDPRNYVFVSNKSIVVGDIKVDDRVINLEGAERKILFTAYHNDEISLSELKDNNIERANNWIELYELLVGEKYEK